jgi:hypothetical protein
MLSLVLATVALVLFFLPVLGIPLAICALCVGVFGTVLGCFGIGGRLRWALLGLILSVLALGANLAVDNAPGGSVPSLRPPPSWRPAPDRPSIPPPAPPA